MAELVALQSGTRPRHNDPAKTIAQRLWDKATENVEGCWIWTAAINSKGYGTTTDVKRGPGRAARVYAHRLAWSVMHGEIPAGLSVDHVIFD
ncbi:HNH endonuclease, partial [Bifidobacterium boum]|uniref:HNH endonuclease n=1 Tax=Bifidobacterium boum TaxID=78343 RepID=UPI003F8FE842